MDGLKDHFGVLREGVWMVSLCLDQKSVRIVFSEGTTCHKVSKVKFGNFTLIVKEFIV